MPARSARSGAPDGTTRSPTHTAPARRGSWPVSNGTSDSRPEPSSPATPTISPRPTAKLAAASAPPARPSACRQAVAVPLRAARVAATAAARPTMSSTSRSWSSPERGTEATRRPSRRTDTWSATSSTSSRSWDTSTTPTPLSRRRRRMPNRRSTSAAGRAAVGSSSTSTCVARLPALGATLGRSGHGLAVRLGRRFVVVDGAGDREAGALGRRERGHRGVHVDVDVHVGEGGAGLAGLGPPADLPEAAGAVAAAERQVVDDTEAGDQAEILVDEPETELVPGAGDPEPERLAADRDRGARVGGVHAGQHLDEGRLARPVLADEGVDLARPHVEVDACQCPLAREGLGQPPHLEHDARPARPWCPRRTRGTLGGGGGAAMGSDVTKGPTAPGSGPGSRRVQASRPLQCRGAPRRRTGPRPPTPAAPRPRAPARHPRRRLHAGPSDPP